MTTRSVFASAAVAALVLIPTLVFAQAAAPESDAWSNHVARDLRELVPKRQHDRILGSLLEMLGQPRGGRTLSSDLAFRVAASPCGESLADLILEFYLNEEVAPALDLVAAGVRDLPEDYHAVNPWKSALDGAALLELLADDFLEWCTFLPEIHGSFDNGLEFIQRFAWLYYQNPAAIDFVQGRNPRDPGKPLATGLRFTNDFSDQRGTFLDSRASRGRIRQWIDDPRIEIEDYTRTEPDEYDSWNDFFARDVVIDRETRTIPSRPVTMPDRDYVVTAPTDCIMNPLVQVLVESGEVRRRLVENPLQFDTVLDVKGIPIPLDRLLGSLDPQLKAEFVGGTGLSCVLMPNTYHHFHAPVSGRIVHAEVISKRQVGEHELPEGTFGYSDWPNWVPLDGNVGRPGTDFSQFDAFERGVIVIEVEYAGLDGHTKKGWVASIPVGLDTIGSVVLADDTRRDGRVKRGYSDLGHFLYGGSLNILLFSHKLASGIIQTRLGNQITLLNVGEPPS